MTDIDASRKLAQEAVDMLYRIATHFVSEGREHRPMAYVRNEKDENTFMALELDNKDQIARFFENLCRKPDCKVAVLLMEAYMYHAEPSDPKSAELMRRLVAKEVEVKDIPHHFEVLMLNIVALGKQWLCTCKIDRAARTLEKGELIDPAFKRGEGVVGRFVQDLPAGLEEAVYANVTKKSH